MTVRPSCPCLTDSSLAAPTLLLLRLELQVPIHAAAAAAATITSVCKEQRLGEARLANTALRQSSLLQRLKKQSASSVGDEAKG